MLAQRGARVRMLLKERWTRQHKPYVNTSSFTTARLGFDGSFRAGIDSRGRHGKWKADDTATASSFSGRSAFCSSFEYGAGAGVGNTR